MRLDIACGWGDKIAARYDDEPARLLQTDGRDYMGWANSRDCESDESRFQQKIARGTSQTPDMGAADKDMIFRTAFFAFQTFLFVVICFGLFWVFLQIANAHNYDVVAFNKSGHDVEQFRHELIEALPYMRTAMVECVGKYEEGDGLLLRISVLRTDDGERFQRDLPQIAALMRDHVADPNYGFSVHDQMRPFGIWQIER